MSASTTWSAVGPADLAGAGLGFVVTFGAGGSVAFATANQLGPAPLVRAQAMVLDRHGPLGDGVEERAIVGDEQDGPGEGLECGLERLAALEV